MKNNDSVEAFIADLEAEGIQVVRYDIPPPRTERAFFQSPHTEPVPQYLRDATKADTIGNLFAEIFGLSAIAKKRQQQQQNHGRVGAKRTPKMTPDEKFDAETRRQLEEGPYGFYGSSASKGIIILHRKLTIAFRLNQGFYEVAFAHRHEDDEFDAFIGADLARRRLANDSFVRIPAQTQDYEDSGNHVAHITAMFSDPQFAFDVPAVNREIRKTKSELNKKFPFANLNNA